MAKTHVAQRRLKLGADTYAEVGDPVPQAATWPNVSTYERLGWIALVDVGEVELATEAEEVGQEGEDLSDLEGLDKSELKERARAAGLVGYSRLSKTELIDLLTG